MDTPINQHVNKYFKVQVMIINSKKEKQQILTA